MRNIKRVILVTGSGKRIGREIVLGLSKNSKNFQFILHYNNSYKEVLDLIKRLKDQGIAVLLISHRMPDIFAVCEKLVVLRRGEKVCDKKIKDSSTEEATGLITGAIDRI